jgi:molybdopterin/thiamine biosynthesis adenylyltransferase
MTGRRRAERGDVMTRFDYSRLVDRNIGILDERRQATLRDSPMAVFGLGGLGGVIAQVLVRAGVTSLALVDNDRFEPTDLNRQVYAYDDTLGELKTEATGRQLKKINPELSVRKFVSVSEANVGEILEGAKVALLAIDKIEPCLVVSRAARERGVPLVEGWAIPFANARVFDRHTPTLEETYGLPTAGRPLSDFSAEDFGRLGLAMLETLLKIEGVAGYYPPAAVERIRRGETPSFAPFVWLTATLMALEAIKVALGWGNVASAPAYALYDPVVHRIPRQE